MTTCRPGCAACCIAPSITSPIPGMPQGKPAGVPCVQLDEALRCRLFGRPERPAVCSGLTPSAEMCGADRTHALRWLAQLEATTSPAGVAAPAAMPTVPLADRLRPLYPVLDTLPDPLRASVLATEVAHHVLPAGTPLFDEGAPCRGFPMVLRGEVRVARGHPQGRSLELYRVTPGELCVASTACLFGQRPLVAHGHTAAPTELALLTPAGFEQWLSVPAFRAFVFGVFADRLADLMALAEAVAFQRLDQRLAAALLGQGGTLVTTHQRLADELGTVREIVTRLLKRFERAGWVDLGRERIGIRDAAALRALAAGATAAPR